MAVLVWGGPILVGFLLGYFLALPANIVVTVVAVAFAGYALWSTKDAELGGLIGVIVAFIVGIGVISQWVTIALVSGFILHIDLSWLLRGAIR